MTLSGCTPPAAHDHARSTDDQTAYIQRAQRVCTTTLGRFTAFAAEDASPHQLHTLAHALTHAAADLDALTPPHHLPPGHTHGTYAERQAILITALRAAAHATTQQHTRHPRPPTPHTPHWRHEQAVLALALVRAAANEPLQACAVGAHA